MKSINRKSYNQISSPSSQSHEGEEIILIFMEQITHIPIEQTLQGNVDLLTGVSVLDPIDNVANDNKPVIETTPEGIIQNVATNFDSLRLSVNDTFPEEQFIFELDGVPFFSIGNIHGIKAKQKSGKTTAIALMVVSILVGKWERIKTLMQQPRVLWIDTEQSGPDGYQIYIRVLRMAGHPDEDIHDRFEYFCFRSLTREEKMEAVRALIITHKPDIVFIDGVVDLIGNFNDLEQSKAVIDELMRLCTKEVVGKDVAIVLVLHTNKAKDDDNMRGHLGTMLAQKAATVLEVKKSDAGFMTVSNSDARHRQVPDWSFMYDNCTGEVVPADELRDTRLLEERLAREADKQYQQEQVRQQRVEKVRKIITNAGGQMAKGTLKIQMAGELRLGRSSIDTHLRKWIEDGIIVENANKVITLPTSTVASLT